MNTSGQQAVLRQDQRQALEEAGIKPAIKGWVILLGMAVFFPIGFLLLFIRSFKHWSKRFWHAYDLRLAGHGFVIIAAELLLLFTMVENSSTTPDPEGAISAMTLISIIFAIPALICYFVASGKKKLVQKDYLAYGHLASDKRVVTLAELALFSQRREKEVIEDMKYLSAIGYFPHHTWDAAAGRLVGKDSFRSSSDMESSYKASQESAAAKSQSSSQGAAKSMECPGCGASVLLAVGEKRECEFCGSLVTCS